MRIIYPSNPLNPREADEPYQDEYRILRDKGVNCSLFDLDNLDFAEFFPKPKIQENEVVLYRGWMLSPSRYHKLVGAIGNLNAIPLTSIKDYLDCHHIINWYEICKEFTPETKFFTDLESLRSDLSSLNWGSYFVKDYVKSNTTELGSIAKTELDVLEIVSQIEKYRGGIEGGIAIRRVEHYVSETEQRHFVFNKKVYSPLNNPPDLVFEVARRISAPFFSIDTVQNTNGIYRLVEVGDGQVSDKKNWPIIQFTNMIMENA